MNLSGVIELRGYFLYPSYFPREMGSYQNCFIRSFRNCELSGTLEPRAAISSVPGEIKVQRGLRGQGQESS